MKILQVFFKNRVEILILKKILNFLSFLVLLYISGHFKQKKLFFNLPAKRGGSLFEGGSEREENRGGRLRSERCVDDLVEGIVAGLRNSDRRSVRPRPRYWRGFLWDVARAARAIAREAR